MPSFPPARLLGNVTTLLSGCFRRQGWCSRFPPLGLANCHTSFSMGKTSLKPAGQSLAFSLFLCNNQVEGTCGGGKGTASQAEGAIFSASSKKSKAGLFPSLPFITSDFLQGK